MIGDFHLLRPLWLLAFIPVALAWWALWRRQDAEGRWKRLIAPHLLTHLLVGRERRARIRPIHLLLVLWVLMVTALAGPSWKREPSPFAEDTAAMIVLLKVTPSMMAEDVAPNRLERAKQKIRDLLAIRKGAATGLIVYSGSAHLLLPPTSDRRILTAMVEGVVPETMPKEGDALVEALQLAQKVFADSGKAGSIVVLADAVSSQQVSLAADSASKLKTPVQFLSLQAFGTLTEPGLEDMAQSLNAKVTAVTVDDADIEVVQSRARREMRSVLAEESGERWKDSGYTLVPIITLVALLWARRGWSTP